VRCATNLASRDTRQQFHQSQAANNDMRDSVNDRLKVLHLEDDPDFASLVKELLDSSGLHTETMVVNSAGLDFERS